MGSQSSLNECRLKMSQTFVFTGTLWRFCVCDVFTCLLRVLWQES